MPVIEESVDIEAPSTDVFRYCHDFASRPMWDDRVLRIKLLSSAPVRSGTLLSVDAARAGQYAYTWDAEYAAYQFPRSSTLRVIDAAPSSPFVKGSTETWTFTSVGARGTRFTLKWDYKTKGFLGRLTDRIGGRSSMRRAIRRSLANLKRAVERS